MRVALGNISVRFGPRVVLNDVALTVEAPSSVAVLGPSGAGKSTLLAVLAGLLAPDTGTRTVEDPAGDTLRLAWVIQSSPVLSRRTVLDNVAIGPLSSGYRRDEAIAASLDVLHDLGTVSSSAPLMSST
jgi:ABC-type nitrate/sulfonate/bicarbonate transport system ATPase subunit